METSGTVLLVEDDPNDVILVRRAFRLSRIPYRLVILSDGLQAKDYLNGAGPYRDREQFPMPVLVLLDLNLPELNGFALLEWLRSETELSGLPVVVLTGSSFSADIKRAYELGANSFLVKPAHASEFAGMLRAMAEFWLETCKLPSPAEATELASEEQPDAKRAAG